MLSALDLFYGCGGLSEGLRHAGFPFVGAEDLDRILEKENGAMRRYQMNHPLVPTWETDIATISAG